MTASPLPFKRGDKVNDTWFPRWRTGRVVKVLKTQMDVCYPDRSDEAHFPGDKNGVVRYDKAHTQFLRKVR